VLVVLITKQERFIAEFASDKNVKIGKYLAKVTTKNAIVSHTFFVFNNVLARRAKYTRQSPSCL